MLTWDECYRQGMGKREAALEMNCDARTASRALQLAGQRHEARIEAQAAARQRYDHDVRHVATKAARPAIERSSYPDDCIALSDLNLGNIRSFEGPLTDRIRDRVASGIPYTEITLKYDNPHNTRESLSRAQSDFDAAARYKARWAEIDAQSAKSA